MSACTQANAGIPVAIGQLLHATPVSANPCMGPRTLLQHITIPPASARSIACYCLPACAARDCWACCCNAPSLFFFSSMRDSRSLTWFCVRFLPHPQPFLLSPTSSKSRQRAEDAQCNMLVEQDYHGNFARWNIRRHVWC